MDVATWIKLITMPTENAIASNGAQIQNAASKACASTWIANCGVTRALYW